MVGETKLGRRAFLAGAAAAPVAAKQAVLAAANDAISANLPYVGDMIGPESGAVECPTNALGDRHEWQVTRIVEHMRQAEEERWAALARAPLSFRSKRSWGAPFMQHAAMQGYRERRAAERELAQSLEGLTSEMLKRAAVKSGLPARTLREWFS